MRIQETAKILNKGGIIVYPTDTIYGIGCLLCFSKSIKKIFRIKKRPKNKPVLIMVRDIEMLKEYAVLSRREEKIVLGNIKKPISFIVKAKKGKIPEIVNAKGDTVGIRFPNTIFLKKLIKEIKYPLITTSANISGKPFPKRFKDIDKEILDKVELGIKGKNLTGRPSKIIDLATEEILRE